MESIFERDFYPTPEAVIEQMLQGHDVSGKIILEPSAGSGNIVGYLQNSLAKEVIACEKNEKLRRIVEGKCKVIAGDFLTVTSEMVSHVDMIVMNPPFSDARRHILHAFEIAPGGCEIISLCNSADVNIGWNSTTDKERVCELVENYGFDEYLGQCFSSAERKTDVSVSCIHIFKPKSGDQEFEDYMFSTEEEVDTGNAEGLIEYNLVRDVVNRYCEAVKRFDDVIAASEGLNELTGMFRKEYGGIVFGAYKKHESNGGIITRQQFKNDLQKRAWHYIIDKLNLDRYATSKVHEQINRFVERQSHVPFTMKNVYQMIYLLIGTQGNRMETALVEAFDHICSFSAENSTAGEKWKTNSNYMVNRKFIVPNVFESRCYSHTYPHLNLSYSSYSRSKVSDVCTALEYISGKTELRSMFSYIGRENLEWGKWHTYGGFFRFKGFKKGTMHVEFLDEDLWILFNRRVAEIKGWQLPKKTGKREAV